MIAFSSARRAALCAIAAQRAFAAYCESHPDLPIRVRMGLHVGEAINESSDYFGKAVIQAARIATLAQGGQILRRCTTSRRMRAICALRRRARKSSKVWQGLIAYSRSSGREWSGATPMADTARVRPLMTCRQLLRLANP